MPLNRSFWQDKRVLVTGHTGFKGAWLTLLLHGLGAKISGLSLEPSKDSLFSRASLGELVPDEPIDVRDLSRVQDFIGRVDPEVVIHLAALSLVRPAFRDPLQTFSTNTMGTAHVLEACRKCQNLRTILVATTDKVYLNLENGEDFTETESLGATEPYAASKVGAEWVTSAYRSSYLERNGISVLVARAGNVVGGGDWSEDRLIPDIVRAAHKGQSLEIRSPDAVRPWSYISDILHGYLQLIEFDSTHPIRSSDPSAYAFNFAPSSSDGPVTVRQICDQVAALWPEFSWYVGNEGAKEIKESRMLGLDAAKSETIVEWQPRFSATESVERTLKWYARCAGGESARDLCIEDLQNADLIPSR